MNIDRLTREVERFQDLLDKEKENSKKVEETLLIKMCFSKESKLNRLQKWKKIKDKCKRKQVNSHLILKYFKELLEKDNEKGQEELLKQDKENLLKDKKVNCLNFMFIRQKNLKPRSINLIKNWKKRRNT